ncbi:DUF6087 family protein [Streptomyces niveus]|uniref:DUF6087 family protein n=1 Tax=Streptomyces niveus TaxID=193462 RepID=UPI0036EC2CB4
MRSRACNSGQRLTAASENDSRHSYVKSLPWVNQDCASPRGLGKPTHTTHPRSPRHCRRERHLETSARRPPNPATDASRGKWRAALLTEDPHHGAHVEPQAPRAIEEWDGDRWVAVGVADALAVAKSLMSVPRPAGRDKDRGRHGKPDPTGENRLTANLR